MILLKWSNESWRKATHRLIITDKNYDLLTPTNQSLVKAFKGKHPVGSKIVIYN